MNFSNIIFILSNQCKWKVEEVVKDHANSNKLVGNGNKARAPFSMIIIQAIMMEDIKMEAVVVVEVVEVVAIVETKIINKIQVVGIITTTNRTTYLILTKTMGVWEEEGEEEDPTRTTKTSIRTINKAITQTASQIITSQIITNRNLK